MKIRFFPARLMSVRRARHPRAINSLQISQITQNTKLAAKSQ
jgi:hypothetical protein